MRSKITIALVIAISFLVCTPQIGAQSHFHAVWEGKTPYQAMNIYITSITLTLPPIALAAGDEVAVFDGSTCVGVATITIPVPSYIPIIASTNDPTTPEVDGFAPGNTIKYRYWKQSNNTEDEPDPVSIVYSVGDGNFASLGTAVVQLTFKKLPVQISSFNVNRVESGKVQLNWTTLSEMENYGFQVERSDQAAADFVPLADGFVPGHGTTVEMHAYSYTDATAGNASWYYRLKQIDLDGSVHYTDPLRVSAITGIEETDRPGAFMLWQNYPNPFNPETSIRFALPKETRVQLDVYSVLGQLASKVVDEVLPAGCHTVKFSGAGLGSGIYMCRLTAGEHTSVRKMSLVK